MYTPADLHTQLEFLGHVRGLEGRAAGRPPAARGLGRRLLRRQDPRRCRGACAGRPTDWYAARYTYVLLEEAEAIVRAQKHIYLWPCDCRSIVGKCRKPMDVCLRFENDRGVG